MSPRSLAALISRPPDLPGVGDYVTDRRELYRVEHVDAGRALIEDCRSEKLIDIELEKLAALEPVRPARGVSSPDDP